MTLMADEKNDESNINDAPVDLQNSLDDGVNSSSSWPDLSTSRIMPPNSVEMPPTADELHSDLIISSPMKLADILSLLLESPDKLTPVQTDMSLAESSFSQGEFGGRNATFIEAPKYSFPLLQRSHSFCEYVDSDQNSFKSSFGNSVSIMRRSHSADNFLNYPEFGPSTSISSQIYFPSSQGNTSGDDSFRNLLYDSAETSQEKAPPPSVIVSGYSLPLIMVDGNPNSYVCVTDVFQSFFSTRHWDEFKNILEKNAIRTISAVSSLNENAFGVPEIVEAISVNDVESLLLSNQARKDGFVRCTRLSMDDIGLSVDASTASTSKSIATESKVIMVPERKIGELSSGIRTRHGDQSDILYVELDGFTLPSIIYSNVQYVRLADVQHKFFPVGDEEKETSPAIKKLLQALKYACSVLGIEISKCKLNEKARMVVYASSCHSSSLHMIEVQKLPSLIAYMRKKFARKAAKQMKKKSLQYGSSHYANGHCSLETNGLSVNGIDQVSPLSASDSVESDGTNSSTKHEFIAPSSLFQNHFATKRRATLDANHKASKQRRRNSDFISKCEPAIYDNDFVEDEGKSDINIWCDRHCVWHSLYDECEDNSVANTGNYTTNVKNIEPCDVKLSVDLTNDLELGRDEDNMSDLRTPKEVMAPCSIIMDSSFPLPVVVYNRHGSRGPAGKYYDHLFVSKNATCILCLNCVEFYSLCDFLNHTHDGSSPVPNPQLFMWVSNIRESKLGLWESLLQKARKYDLKEFSQYKLMEDINSDKGETCNSGTHLQTNSGNGSSIQLTGGPAPPPPPPVRRRPARGDAMVDIMERYSSTNYKPPSSKIVGYYSNECEDEVDASYGN